ncbi:MAG: hypothetical protein ACFFBP_13535 [Promethearchaeota archaeon]
MPRNQQDKYILDYLWILERRSGNCVFQHDFNPDTEEIKYPLDIISSFFTAFSSLVDTIYSDKIKKIHFQGFRFYFKATKKFVFITNIKDNKKLSDSKIDKLLLKIIEKFSQRFQQKNDFLNDFSDNSDYYNFIDTLEELVRNNHSSVHFLHIF